MIVFLDFDGVLHPFGSSSHLHIWGSQVVRHGLFCCLPVVEGVLRQFPEVEIVISSSWREYHPFDEMQDYFSTDIRERIVGMTPVIRGFWTDARTTAPESLMGYSRHIECVTWLRKNRDGFTSWLAIDDDKTIFRPDCKQLLLTESMKGFTEFDAHELRLRLHAMEAGEQS